MTKTILTPFLVGLLFFCFVMAGTMSIAVGATIVSVSITPVSASIDIGESVVFNSTLMGASIPYWYTWFLNGAALSETGTPWNFTPSTKGTYNVYLKVYPSINDTDYNIAQSETAHLVVGGESFIGVLGYPKGSSQASGSGTQYTVDGSRFSLDVESNVTSMSCLMHYQTIPYDPTRN